MQNYSKEIWKDVKGYEGYYQVSNKGRVRSLSRTVKMSDGRNYRCKGKNVKVLWKKHYCFVFLSKDGDEQCLLVHRLVLESFVGLCPKGMECCHYDGDSRNNNVENLRWDTRANNALDRARHGTNKGQPPGEGHWNCKLTESQVREIRKLVRFGNCGELARRFCVSQKTISDIAIRRSWKHI